MGLFDKVMGFGKGAPETLDSKESVLGVLLATIGADGDIAPEELDSLSAVANRMGMFNTMSQQQFSTALRKVLGLLKKKGAEELMGMSTGQVPEAYRETCFALCIDIVLADGNLDPAEEAMMTGLQKALGISDDLARKVLEVMLIKNKP